MAEKPTKIDDVKRPGKSAPLPTSRPIVVTNRPMLANDPMVVSTVQESDDAKSAAVATRMAKVIKPLDSTLAADSSASETASDPKEPDTPTPSTVPELAVDIDALHEQKEPSADAKPVAQAVPAEVASKVDNVVAKSEAAAGITTSEKIATSSNVKLERDPEAELTAEEIAAAEAKAKRDLELEQVITSGKYHVPINAVQRRRSRMHILLLCVIGAILVVVLVDVVIDAGFVKLPVSLPHTHFFSTTAASA
ncbi:MAG TPA: hypothetical protein VLG92_02980 [Candidatus Saccharimonadia bacterium]|nr:hypothetical protein [Candidatus Saccharimonadia bacterium]